MSVDIARTTGPAAMRPAFATINQWCLISGLGRRVVYELIGQGQLRAIKRGSTTLVDVDHGLAYLRSLPPAKIKAAAPNAKKGDAA